MGKVAQLLAVILGVVAVAACGGGNDRGDLGEAPTSTPDSASTVAATETVDPDGTVGISELARGVVQVFALDANNNTVWSGSGTVIDASGLILTNAHVVDDRQGDYATLGIAVTDRTDSPPVPSFVAEIAAVDYVIDLAVIRVVSDLDGGAANFRLPAVQIGSSDAVELGDTLQILGFPGIGGETITLTQGIVSGFNAQNSIATRAWIKTDATISGGNSGGLAANERGEIVGIPTIAGSTTGVSPVDCRTIVDTNRDGVVDDSDTCVPIGGFINGLRPIALALPLIEAARAEEAYVSAFGPETPAHPEYDFDTITFTGLVFSDGVAEDNRPTQIVKTLPSETPNVCAFWEYDGMVDGLTWEALWFVDGDVSEVGSFTAQSWVGGTSGTWWVCFFDDEGLADGLYELALSVEGRLFAAESLFIGGIHPLVEVTIENRSEASICFVHLSPSDALNWGPDELGVDDTIESGQSWTFEVPAGTIDLRVLDCSDNVLAEEYQLDANESGTYTLN